MRFAGFKNIFTCIILTETFTLCSKERFQILGYETITTVLLTNMMEL